jgi:hypothetical protein
MVLCIEYISMAAIGFLELPHFRPARFFEFPTSADTESGSADWPCFTSDHIKPLGAEDRSRSAEVKSLLGHVQANQLAAMLTHKPGLQVG